jgi:hypothetical protein
LDRSLNAKQLVHNESDMANSPYWTS